MPLDVNEFANKIKAKYPEYKDVDNNLLAEKMIEKYPEYKGKVSFEPSKKKVVSELPSEQKVASSLSATQKTAEQKPSVSSGSEDNLFSGYPGKEAKKYKLKDSVWYEYSSTIPKEGGKNIDLYEKPIENKGRVDALNKVFKQSAYYGKQNKTEEELKKKIIAQQKELKGKGYDVDINGLLEGKTLIAQNKDQAKTIVTEKDKIEKQKVLNSIDAYINSGLVGNEEEQVVPFLRKKFGNQGFIFEESGAGDNLSISYSPDGIITTKAGEISLDNWTTNKDVSEMNKLKTFMRQAYMTTSEKKEISETGNVRKLASLMAKNPEKYGNELVSKDWFDNHVNKSYNTLTLELKWLNADYKSLDDQIINYNENPTTAGLKSIQNKQSELDVRKYAIVKEYGELDKATKDYSKAVGVYAKDKASKGNFIGIVSAGLAQGMTNIEKMAATVAADVIPYIVDEPVDPATKQQFKEMGYTDAQIKDYAAKELKQRILPKLKEGIQNIATLGTTTSEYVQSSDRNDIEKTANFLSESIGTALSGGGNPLLQKIAFFSQSYNAMEDQMMKGQDFEGLSETEKKLVSVPYGIAIGALEKLGFDISAGTNATVNNMISKVIARTFTQLPKDASIELIERTIIENVKLNITRGVAKTAASSASEWFVEGVQNLAETGEKFAVNKIEGFEYFKDVPDITTKEGAMKALNAAKTDAYYGALGGAIMSGISQSKDHVVNGYNEKLKDDDFYAWVESVSDENLVRASKLDIKTKFRNGDITKDEAKEQLKGIDEAISIVNQIPPEYKVRDKRDSFNLINEKAKLEKSIEGKDKALVTAQTDRISAINEELKSISINNSKPETEISKWSNLSQYKKDVKEIQNSSLSEDDKASMMEGLISDPISYYKTEIAMYEDMLFNKEGNETNTPFQIKLYNGYIKERKNKLKKYEDYATKESEQQEVPTESSTVEYQGTNEGQQEVGQGEGSERTTTQPEANISNSDIASEEAQVSEPVEPTEEQILDDVKNKRFASFNYENESQVPEQFKDKISSKGYTNGKNVVTVTLPQSVADYEIQKAEYNKSAQQTEEQVILPTKNKAGEITGYISQVTDVGGNVVDIEGKTEAEVKQKIADVQQTIEQPTLDELKTLDVSDKTNLQKVQSFLDNALNDLDSFGKETLGMNLPVAVARVVLKTVKTLVDAGVSLEQAFKQAAETHNVQEVDIADTLTAISNRKKETEASKAAKNISKKEKTKVTVDEYTALRDQIRLEARAAKDVKKKQADMIEAINTSSKTGKISAAKAKALINRIQKVKLESDKSINEFLRYADRIFKDAEYGDKLSKSQSLRAKIRKGIKREGVQAQVVGTLKAFSKIDPKKVENIDEYKAYAEQLTEASKTTRVSKDGKPNFKVPAFLADINKYAASEMQRQNDLDKQELLDKYDDLVENKSISGNMSLKDIQKYVATLETKDEEIDSQKEADTRDYTQREFDRLAEIINEELSNEESDISALDKKRLRDILKIDLNKLSTKDAFQIVEHLDNFITNGITSNLDNIQATYDGAINAENLEKSGLKSYAIKLLFSPKIGKLFGKQTMSLPTFIDNIFGGEKRSLAFSKAMGLTGFMNSKSQAIVRYRNKMAQHKAQFEKKRPNGKDFNASDNIQERGVFAYLLRNSLDGDTSMFKDRVSNTLITIDKLLNSKDKNEIKKGEILNAVADKLGLRDENVTIESVTANVDPINQQDVDWWVNTWGEIYGELADVSLAVYNIELSPDAFYTTDTVSDTDRVDSFLSDENLSGLGRTLTTQPDDKRTGVLRENNRHKVTAKGKTMINFNFDANQDRAFKAALVDLYTAKDIRQMKSFLKSDSFKNIMDSKGDAELLALKVVNSIKRSKGKSLEESDQIAKDVERLANRSAVLGTSMVLGRPTQWLLQTIPVLGNTLINTGDLNIRNMFNKSANEFVANSGRGIALRGKESLSMIESAEKYLDKNPDSMLGKSMEAFDWLNNKYLEVFLVNADTFTANASWLAYYEQSLRKQGVHPGGKIDWANHEMNEEAADYAQHKINRQQNISDPDFGGELFTSKVPYVRMSVKAIMPFSNFIMNQKSRMYADLKAVKRGDADEKASAARSLAGLAVESVIYRAMSGIIGYYLWTLANGGASDEEKEKKKKRAINNAVSSVATDVFALAPTVNSTTIKALNILTAFGQDYMHNDEMNKLVLDENNKRAEDRKPKMGTAEEEEFRRLALEEMIFQIDEYEAKDSGLGVFGIAYEKGGNLVDLVKKRALGKYMDENPLTKVKSTKYLVEKDQEDMSLALVLQSLHTLRILPQELSQVSGY